MTRGCELWALSLLLLSPPHRPFAPPLLAASAAGSLFPPPPPRARSASAHWTAPLPPSPRVMGNRCGRSSHPPEPAVAAATTPARRSATAAAAASASQPTILPSSSSPASAAMSKPDARQLSHRLKAVMQLQHRLSKHLPIHPRDRGMLIAALAMLYQHEEVDAREKIARERAKKRKEAAKAAAEVADSAALVALFSESAEDAAAAWGVTPDQAAASSAAASTSAAAPALPSECQVCFSAFNTEFEGAWTLRVHMTLCGHASICADCFRTYLSTRIEADDVMPFIGCPEPGCKSPLSHFDITAALPTLEAAHAFEAAQAREKENAAKRDQAALQRKAQRKLFAAKQAQADAISSVVVAGRDSSATAVSASSTTASESDDESSPAQRKSKKHDSGSPGKKKRTERAAGARRKSSAAATSSDDDSAALDASLLNLALDGSNVVPQAPALTVAAPAAPAAPRPPPLLSTELLLKLTLTHLTKALRQCKDWLPCGTHPLTPPAPAANASASAPVAPAPDAPAAVAASSSSAVSSAVPAASAASTASAASASAPSPAAPSASACPFGFVLLPSYAGLVSHKDKLKKCELCGTLQCVKPKTPENCVDGSMEALIAEGTLRACPVCEALQMKDLGMCNILQCHQCSIWSAHMHNRRKTKSN